MNVVSKPYAKGDVFNRYGIKSSICYLKSCFLSGLSGLVRAINSYPGQRKASTSLGLRVFVRAVRAKTKSYTYAHARTGSDCCCFLPWELRKDRTDRTNSVKSLIAFRFFCPVNAFLPRTSPDSPDRSSVNA